LNRLSPEKPKFLKMLSCVSTGIMDTKIKIRIKVAARM
jgi:hypothetical protein